MKYNPGNTETLKKKTRSLKFLLAVLITSVVFRVKLMKRR